MQIETLNSLYKLHKEHTLFGRYIHTDIIKPLLKQLPDKFKVDAIGKSVLLKNIYSVTFGSGPKKIFIWSQMHGNESTTTKSIFDLFNVLKEDTPFTNRILSQCTIKIIPILNPDGAEAYTRLNHSAIDLNRDAKNLTQPESRVLRYVFDGFNPNFCFNLHGQRTIFSVLNTNNPATVSFLAPAQDIDCSITLNRKKAMEIVSVMNTMLQKQIPNQIGLYDDAYNANCVGDTFQSKNVPTILFEAGHYANDYQREQTRAYIFQSLMSALVYISNTTVDGNNFASYMDIPKNEKCFFDIIIRNANIISNGKLTSKDIAFQYQEILDNKCIHFVPRIEKIASNLNQFYGHKEINANNQLIESINNKGIKVGYENDFVKINNERLSLKLTKT